MSRTGFRLLDPVKSLRQQVDFVRQLHDREALLPRERQRRFLMGEGSAWPGPAVADFLRQFVAHNRMLQGGFVIADRTVTLADIDRPVLTVVGIVDEIAPAPAVRAIVRAAPRAEVYELALRAGHFGLVVGSLASQTTWPTVAAWTRWRAEEGELPASVKPAHAIEHADDPPDVGTRLGVGLGLVAGVGAGLARSLAGVASRTVGGARVLAEELRGELPRLARLGRLGPDTRVSLGLLLDEQARHSPEADFFLFEDRAYSHQDANRRVDNVVRGLLSLGVRQGEHRRSDEHATERPLGGRGAQPPRGGGGADAFRRAGRARGRARPGEPGRRGPRARRPCPRRDRRRGARVGGAGAPSAI